MSTGYLWVQGCTQSALGFLTLNPLFTLLWWLCSSQAELLAVSPTRHAYSYVQALALAVPLPTTPFPPGVCLHRLLPQLPQVFAQGHMGKLPLDILCKFQPSLASPVQTASCITLWRPFPAACKLHKGKLGMFWFLFGLVWFPVIFPMPRKVPAKSRPWINTDWINEWMNEYMRRASNSFL